MLCYILERYWSEYEEEAIFPGKLPFGVRLPVLTGGFAFLEERSADIAIYCDDENDCYYVLVLLPCVLLECWLFAVLF